MTMPQIETEREGERERERERQPDRQEEQFHSMQNMQSFMGALVPLYGSSAPIGSHLNPCDLLPWPVGLKERVRQSEKERDRDRGKRERMRDADKKRVMG